jgi:two-component system C4-dicarboxylate transport sensor histidine kinase DctB
LRIASVIRRSFERWSSVQDLVLLREAGSPRAALAASLFVSLLLPALRYLPGVGPYVQLRLVPPFLIWTAIMLVHLIGYLLQRNRPVDYRTWLFQLLHVFEVQFFCASLVAWSGLQGSAAISSLFLFTAAYHGHLYRATLAEPFVAVATVLAIAGVILINPSGNRVGLLVLIGIAGITAELMLGTTARNKILSRSHTERLHAAVRAQILKDQVRQVERLSDTVVDLLGRGHDMGNALMVVQLTADSLELEFGHPGSTGAEIPQLTDELRQGIARLAKYVSEMKSAHHEVGALTEEPVQVVPVLEMACAGVQARFPNVRQALLVDPLRQICVSLRGGPLTLHRVIENLLLNACEGDGTRTARTVEVEVTRDPSGAMVQIVVRDDGPGFRADELQRPIEGFATRKAQGTGLGLYTSERLVQASGGSLSRANRVEGGAAVTVLLRIAEPTAKVVVA